MNALHRLLALVIGPLLLGSAGTLRADQGSAVSGRTSHGVAVVLASEHLAGPYVTALGTLEKELRERGIATERIALDALDGDGGIQKLGDRLNRTGSDAVVAVGSRVFARLRDRDLGRPLIFTMVLNPARIDPAGTTPGVRLDCDPADLLGLFGQIFPDRTRIGVVYESASSSGLVDAIRRRVAGMSLSLESIAVRQAQDVPAVQRDLAARVDAFLQVPDACSASRAAFATLRQISFERRIPILALKTASVRDGAAFCGVIDYADVGRQTAEIVDDILHGKTSTGPAWPRSIGLCVNRNTLRYMGARSLSESIRRRVVKWYPESGADR